MDLKRHEGHHHKANIKYGYTLFGISLVAALTLALFNHVYLNKWVQNGSPNRKSVWARLRSPKPLWLHVVGWFVVCFGLTFFNTHDIKENYTTLIKRVGRLGFYLVPFDILLAIRPSLMATSYLEYIALHKWISRLILLMVSTHGIAYFAKWIITDNVWQKSFKLLNFLGVVVFFFSIVLAIISSRPLRARMYKVFYVWHNITVATFVVLIFWHARPGVTDAIILSVCMLGFQCIQRIRKSFWISDIVIIDESNANLRLLRVPKPGNYPDQWHPGAHIRVTYPFSDARSWLFPSHPFTIFSSPNDNSLDLVVKKSHTFQVQRSSNYTLSSPYESIPPPFFQTAEKVVILCGGSGISLGLPVLRFLQTNESVTSELHWSVSNKADSFILKNFKSFKEVNVYVTGDRSVSPERDESQPGDSLLSGSEHYELETLSGDRPESIGELSKEKQGSERIKYRSGRPVLDDIFFSLLEGSKENSWIVVCGPQMMITNAERWGKDHDVQVFSEYYAF